ncbi:MAG TPA: NAD(P)H-hydrate epimerase, partial [Candidatus Krumholzibacteria bacterium]|nr:NAD(P)H-hydrate epimerase [Candidatus Krumholzibacteria bacterium]
MTYRVLTAEQMQRVDADTIAGGVPGVELMERAGRGVTSVILRTLACESGHAAIFVGSGNNGGDGLVVARLLMDAGWTCSIHLLKPGAQCTPDTATNYRRLAGRSGLAEWDARALRWPERALEDVRGATVIVDSIFGTGFSGAPRDEAARMIELVNDAARKHDIPVFSIDIPSGVNGTNGAVRGVAVNADITVTIGAVKTGLLFHPGRSHAGQIEVIDIGFPEDIVTKHSERVFYLGRAQAQAKLEQRAPDMHKYRAGTTLVISGSDRYRGAPLLTGEAALRSGCGMLYLAVPESMRSEIPARLAEAIVIPLAQTSDGTIAKSARAALAPHLERANAVAVGPGLGRNDETDAFVREFVVSCAKPVVVDADALTAFADHTGELRQAKSPLILT